MDWGLRASRPPSSGTMNMHVSPSVPNVQAVQCQCKSERLRYLSNAKSKSGSTSHPKLCFFRPVPTGDSRRPFHVNIDDADYISNDTPLRTLEFKKHLDAHLKNDEHISRGSVFTETGKSTRVFWLEKWRCSSLPNFSIGVQARYCLETAYEIQLNR